MTAQVSDIVVTTRPLRRAVLVHGVASFFYNTGILALPVNAAVTAGQWAISSKKSQPGLPPARGKTLTNP